MSPLPARIRHSAQAFVATPLWQTALIFVGGFLAIAPSLGGGWLWDDGQQVTENVALRSVDGLWRIWLAPAESDYFPLKSTILWGLWHLWGPVPLGYRLFSLCCHLASALLVWRLLEAVGLRWAWLGGMLFAVHPLTVESVAWISELKNTLSLPFVLAAMLLYIRYDETLRSTTLAGAILLFLAAMLCKSSVVMLPAVLLLYCWWKRGSLSRRDIVRVIPFGIISLVLGCVTICFQNSRAIGDNPIPSLGVFARATGAGTNAWFYVGKFLFPTGLSPIYPQWSVASPSIWQLLSLPALLVVLYICWRQRRGWGRHALLGLGFYLLNVLPVLGILKMSFMAFSWVSDHFVYLPMIGLVGLAVAGLEGACSRLPERWRRTEYVAIGGLVAVLVTLSGAHAAIFRSKEAMWTATLRVNPVCFAAHNDLGAVCADEGRLPEAMTHIQEALRIRPSYARARINLGLVLKKAGHLDEAMAEFREAQALNPRLLEAHVNAGGILLAKKDLPGAAKEFRDALAMDPYCVSAYNNLGIISMLQGRTDDAFREFQIALGIDPLNDDAHCNLGIALAQTGKPEDAQKELRKALAINPANPHARAALEALVGKP